MKVLITGAHFTPAVAVVEQLKKYKNTKIVYVGRATTQEGDPSPSAESQILPQIGVKFIPITSGRLQRTFTIYTIPSLLKIPFGFIQALWILLKERPDVILSFGGYVAVPIVFIGWLFSIPIIIHEQSLVSGMANRVSVLFANKIAISFSRENNFDKGKTVLTGNPLRQDILEGVKLGHPPGGLAWHLSFFDEARKEKLPVILITGGNQGSHVINIAVEGSLNKLKKIAYIIHVTGDSKFKDFERLEKHQDDHYLVKKWIGSEWASILTKVDLVISRAGINTLSEMAYLGKPGIVIPIPYLYKNEQMQNARYFENLGLVKMLPQSKLSGNSLLANIKLMLNDLNLPAGKAGHLKRKAKNAKKIIIADAAKKLALETMLLGN